MTSVESVVRGLESGCGMQREDGDHRVQMYIGAESVAFRLQMW